GLLIRVLERSLLVAPPVPCLSCPECHTRRVNRITSSGEVAWFAVAVVPPGVQVLPPAEWERPRLSLLTRYGTPSVGLSVPQEMRGNLVVSTVNFFALWQDPEWRARFRDGVIARTLRDGVGGDPAAFYHRFAGRALRTDR